MVPSIYETKKVDRATFVQRCIVVLVDSRGLRYDKNRGGKTANRGERGERKRSSCIAVDPRKNNELTRTLFREYSTRHISVCRLRIIFSRCGGWGPARQDRKRDFALALLRFTGPHSVSLTFALYPVAERTCPSGIEIYIQVREYAISNYPYLLVLLARAWPVRRQNFLLYTRRTNRWPRHTHART